MTDKSRTARVLMYFVGALLLALGLAGLAVSALPPNMIAFLGMTQDQLDPKVPQIILMLIKMVSVLYLAIGTTVVVLTRRLLHRDVDGTRLALSTLLLPFLFIPVIMLPAGFGPPLIYVPVILVCTAIALVLLRRAEPVVVEKQPSV